MTNTQDNLRALQAAGLSQLEIERRTKIPQPRLSRWASGDVPKSADDALILARLRAEVEEGKQTAV